MDHAYTSSEPTYEGLKVLFARTTNASTWCSEPTYEGLKGEFSNIKASAYNVRSEPTYEGLKGREVACGLPSQRRFGAYL